MRKEATGYGATTEEAYEEAKNNLIADLSGTRYDEDKIEFEIITMPKKKTLGLFGGSKAEVLAYIELADEKPRQPKAQSQKVKKPIEKKTAKQEKNTPPAKKANTVVEKTAAEKDAVAEKHEMCENTVAAEELPADSAAAKAVEYLKPILTGLGCDKTEIKVALRENGAALYLSGDGLGAVIGRRGETLDALQYLCSLAANSAAGYYKININIGNYRERREQALNSLANRIARQVLRTGRSRTLEPMNPYERRIIHTAVQEISGVTSASVGEGAGRRVVISPEKGERSQSARSAKANNISENREPKRDTELPLYGKIN